MPTEKPFGVVRDANTEAKRHEKNGDKPQVASERNWKPTRAEKPLTVSLKSLFKAAGL